jgi:hypothetical protein
MSQHPDCFPWLTVNARVRFRSEHPESEPVGTIIETGYSSVRIRCDDNHPPSIVVSERLRQLEVLR